MKTTEVGKVTVKYDNGEVSSINYSMELLDMAPSELVLHYQNEIRNKLSTNEKEKINEAAQFILANVFSKVTDLELRDFESSELESKVFCNEEDGVITECTIVYYIIEK